MITPTIFRTRFPVVFDATSDASIQVYIDLSAMELSTALMGIWYDEAQNNYVAHKLTIEPRAASQQESGTIVSKKVGDVAITYSQSSQTTFKAGDSYWKTTGYGQEYLRILDMFPQGPVIV